MRLALREESGFGWVRLVYAVIPRPHEHLPSLCESLGVPILRVFGAFGHIRSIHYSPI